MSKRFRSTPWQCRQGDVFLERIENATPGMPISRDAAGRIVLAHGEVTGHAHVVTHRSATLHELDREDRSPVGDAVWNNLVALLRAPKPATLKHDCPGQVKPDHDPIAIPAGDYAVVHQLQYTPEEIRVVAD
jgi:hypothetical protein